MRSIIKRLEKHFKVSKEPTEIWVESRVIYDTQRDLGEVIKLLKITIAPDGQTTREVLVDKTNSKEE